MDNFKFPKNSDTDVLISSATEEGVLRQLAAMPQCKPYTPVYPNTIETDGGMFEGYSVQAMQDRSRKDV